MASAEIEEMAEEAADLRARLAAAEAERDALRLAMAKLEEQHQRISADHQADGKRTDATLAHYRGLVDGLLGRIMNGG